MPGFILTDKSLGSITRYLVIISGLTLILALVCAVIVLVTDIIPSVRSTERYYSCVFLLPVSSLSCSRLQTILANHKYIQITMILSDVFVAILLSGLFLIPFKRRRLLSSEENGAGIESEEAGRTADSVVSAGTGTPEAADAAEGGNITVSDLKKSLKPKKYLSQTEKPPCLTTLLTLTAKNQRSYLAMKPAGTSRKYRPKGKAADSPAFVFGDEEPVVNDTSPPSNQISSKPQTIRLRAKLNRHRSHEAAPARLLYSKGLSPVAWIALEICGVISCFCASCAAHCNRHIRVGNLHQLQQGSYDRQHRFTADRVGDIEHRPFRMFS